MFSIYCSNLSSCPSPSWKSCQSLPWCEHHPSDTNWAPTHRVWLPRSQPSGPLEERNTRGTRSQQAERWRQDTMEREKFWWQHWTLLFQLWPTLIEYMSWKKLRDRVDRLIFLFFKQVHKRKYLCKPSHSCVLFEEALRNYFCDALTVLCAIRPGAPTMHLLHLQPLPMSRN